MNERLLRPAEAGIRPCEAARGTSARLVMERQPASQRQRGRPRDPRKRQALLRAARALFLDHGADGVTVEQVIAGAGVSRATYYSNFADRHELLAAVIAEESKKIVAAETPPEPADDLRRALIDFGDGFLTFLADPDTPRLDPLILHVGRTEPKLGAALFQAGPRRVWDVLERVVRDGQSNGLLDSSLDPTTAVSDLIGMWRGTWYVEVSYGQRPVPDEDERRHHCRRVVDLLLRAYGTQPPGTN